MALLLNPNQIPQDLIAQHDRFTAYSKRCIQFEIQVALIPDQNKFEYQSAQDLVRRVVEFENSEPPEGHLYFHGISDLEYEACQIKIRASHRLGSTLRFTFENSLDAAILNVKRNNLDYNLISVCFTNQLAHKIDSIPGSIADPVSGCGAALFTVPRVRSKQGDQCLRPYTRRGMLGWPSVMVEIGNAEGMDFLRLDAEWWLMHSDKKIRFVILVKLEKDPFAIRLECWMMVETGRRQTRLTPALIPRCVQDFDIDEVGDVKSTLGSTKLEVPYSCIFDEVPNPLPPAATLSTPELSEFALRMFEQIG